RLRNFTPRRSDHQTVSVVILSPGFTFILVAAPLVLNFMPQQPHFIGNCLHIDWASVAAGCFN
ncbi:hypothetical protein, partial [Yoonia sp.]|uniref:hypothetical protein n=1 Tax=Yoonia sp. TaxID=2212373 RepID=UPI0040473801